MGRHASKPAGPARHGGAGREARFTAVPAEPSATGPVGTEDARRKPWRHQSLAHDLRCGIAAGQFPVGTALPTERDLAERHGLSRTTVREALRALEREGLIRRRQGSGTVVLATRPRKFRREIGSLDTLLDYPDDTVVRLDRVDDETDDPLLAAAIGATAAASWMRVALRRYGADQDLPLSVSFVYFPACYSAISDCVEGSVQPVSRLLEARFGLASRTIELQFAAVGLPSVIADPLGVPHGTAAMRLVRLYRDPAGAPFALSVTYHPEDRYTFAATLHQSDPGTAERG